MPRSTLYFDITVLQDWHYSGIHQVCLNLAKEFINKNLTLRFIARGRMVPTSLAVETINALNGALLRTEIILGNLQEIDPVIASKHHAFYPHFRYDKLKWRKYSIVCHDLSPIVFGSAHKAKTIESAKKQLHDFLNANKTIAVSNFTKCSLAKCLEGKINPDQIAVIHNGVSISECRKTRRTEKIAKTPYALYIGSLEPRKNLATLAAAMDRLPKKFNLDLVLVGSAAWGELGKLSANRTITWLKNCHDNEKTELMKNCALMVYPSVFEGFGIPILEGNSLGIPVISGGGSSLSEVQSDKRFIFDQTDPKSIADKILEICSARIDKAALQKHSEKFNWSQKADEYLSVIL